MKEIRNIIKTYDQIDHNKESLAIASVVNVEESSYRRIGARMLVSSTGTWIGGISGGCLEGDALKRSQKAIFNKAPSRVVYDTMDDDKNQIGVGLGCNGRIEVLFTPIDPNDVNNPVQQLRKIVSLGKPAILLKVIDAGKHQEYLGKSHLIEHDDAFEFCKLEFAALRKRIEEVQGKRKTRIIEMTNSENISLKVLIEFIRPETKLIMIGDNYDVNALVGVAKELGWEMYIVGRKKKVHKSTFEMVNKVLEYEQYENIPIDDYTAVILMSHDYNWDKTLLPKVLDQKVPYIGMLGPRKRMEKMESDLGIPLSEIAHLHSPVGLDIGAESPEEIALSICSEIIARFHQRDGKFLKKRPGTIHEREA